MTYYNVKYRNNTGLSTSQIAATSEREAREKFMKNLAMKNSGAVILEVKKAN